MTTPATPLQTPLLTGLFDHNEVDKPIQIDSIWNPARDMVDLDTLKAAEMIAAKVYNILAKGHRINRRNMDVFGLSFNGPLHSYIADVEKMWDLPVERERVVIYTNTGDRIKVMDYWFGTASKRAIQDPDFRTLLANEMRKGRERRYFDKLFRRTEKGILTAQTFNSIERHPHMLGKLNRLATLAAQVAKPSEGCA